GAVALYWLFARIGFLIAPVIAGSQGSVLRTAYKKSAHHLMRDCGLIALLLIPGFSLQVLGEYALRAFTGKPFAGGNLPLADSARLMGDTLAGFVAIGNLSVAISIVLLTAGAMAAYRIGPIMHMQAGANEAYPSSLRV